MIIRFERRETPEALLAQCQAMAAEDDVNGLMILACDRNNYSTRRLNQSLAEVTLPIFGGIFPGIIHGVERYEKGALILGLPRAPAIHTISSLSDQGADFEALIDQAVDVPDESQTMIVFVDGLSTRIADLVAGLFNNFGLEFNYIGGGAGSLSMKQKPCLITNQGMLQDQAVIALLEAASGVGVRHGWEVFDGPFQVTESSHNMIVSIDFKPAFEIYRQAIEPHLGQAITPTNFFQLAKNYPLGFAKLGAEKLVRDPVEVMPDGTIRCVGEIPEGAYIHILAGTVPALVAATRKARLTACNEYPGNPQGKPSFFIDCISRALYLEDKYHQELAAVQRPDAPLVGALTMGEIGCNGKDYLEFYNKTSVVGVVDL